MVLILNKTLVINKLGKSNKLNKKLFQDVLKKIILSISSLNKFD
jgi:hypothetical protein